MISHIAGRLAYKIMELNLNKEIAEQDLCQGVGEDRQGEFLQLFLNNQKRLYGFIRTLVAHKAEAEDILQDTAMIMWKKFSEYEPGTSFLAWGFTIARYNIIYHHRKNKSIRQFSEETLQEILSRHEKTFGEMDVRIQALEQCLSQLQGPDRKMIHLRYDYELRPKAIAKQLDEPVARVYKSLARIHNSLLGCIRRRITTMETTP